MKINKKYMIVLTADSPFSAFLILHHAHQHTPPTECTKIYVVIYTKSVRLIKSSAPQRNICMLRARQGLLVHLPHIENMQADNLWG